MNLKSLKYRNLDLSTKIFIILGPILFLAVVVVIYANYHNQEDLILQQAGSIAEHEAIFVKTTMEYQMVNGQHVGDVFLHRLSGKGQVDRLEVQFDPDSLHLNQEYLTEERSHSLIERSMSAFKPGDIKFADAISSGYPREVVHCSLNLHPDRPISSIKWWEPASLSRCEQLQVNRPLVAEASCQGCHHVATGTILGIVHMNISLNNTTGAIQANAVRTIIILLLFSGLGAFFIIIILHRFVDRPVDNLINATKQISMGNYDLEFKDIIGGDEIGMLVKAFKDMQSNLQTVQAELLHKERLSTVGQMASGIIHDFRGPMNMIAVCVDLLRKGKGLTEEKKIEYFSRARIALDQMKRMTQEILDYSRGEMIMDIHETDLSTFLDNIKALLTPDLERKKIELDVIQSYEGIVFMDQDRIYRALLNLLNNAEDAMPKGGRIELKLYQENERLVLELTDTGGGIPESVRDTLFNPFVTAGKTYGTGLGLAITKKIVDQHQGEIYFKTELQKGTTFWIKIPLRHDKTSQN
jgi:signal transduction histidine kinase